MTPENKPEISYPIDWSYTLIGEDLALMRDVASEFLQERKFSFRPSKASSGKKYFSAIVSCQVENEEDRLDLYARFKSHPDVKMVL